MRNNPYADNLVGLQAHLVPPGPPAGDKVPNPATISKKPL